MFLSPPNDLLIPVYQHLYKTYPGPFLLFAKSTFSLCFHFFVPRICSCCDFLTVVLISPLWSFSTKAADFFYTTPAGEVPQNHHLYYASIPGTFQSLSALNLQESLPVFLMLPVIPPPNAVGFLAFFPGRRAPSVFLVRGSTVTGFSQSWRNPYPPWICFSVFPIVVYLTIECRQFRMDIKISVCQIIPPSGSIFPECL